MQHPTGWPEGSSGDAPFLWWDGDRWTQERNGPRPPEAARRYPEYRRAIDRLRETSVDLFRVTTERRREPRHEQARETGAGHGDEPAADGPPDSVVTLALSGLFAASLLITAAGYGIDSTGLRLGGIVGVLFFGVGAAPLRAFRRAGLTVRLALAVLIGISVPTLLASVMALTPLWHPLIAAALLGTAVAIVHARASLEALRDLRAAPRQRPPADRSAWLNLSTGLTAGGTLYWIAAAVRAGRISPGVGGFLTQIPPMWYGGLLLVLGGIVAARSRPGLAAVTGVASLIAAFTLTPAIVYGLPGTQTAAKHVGFVQQVLGVHYLDRTAGIYQAYSGFFSLSAWICNLAGVKESMGFAAYWPFIINMAGLAVLRLFFGLLLRSPYRVYIAITLTFLVDVVGQDYFSPQSVGYVLVFGVYALGIGGQRTHLSQRMRIGLIAVISSAVAVTHEFSPFIGAAVLVIFVIARVVRPIYIPLAALLPAVVWAVLNWSVLGSFASFYDFGNLSNFEPPKTAVTPGLERLPIVGQGTDAEVAGLLVLIALAAVGFLAAVTRRPGWTFFSRSYAWSIIVSAAAGLALIVANPYGNEGIFRAVLFAIPWLAALAVTAIPRFTREWLLIPLAMLLTGLSATFCIASDGLDNANVIRPGDVGALNFYNAKASGNGYILDLSYGDTPTGMLSLANGHSVGWSTMVPQTGDRVDPLTPESAALLARNYLAYVAQDHGGSTSALYAIWSPAAVSYSIDYGLETAATAVAWEQALVASPIWKLVYHNDGTYLFQLAPQ